MSERTGIGGLTTSERKGDLEVDLWFLALGLVSARGEFAELTRDTSGFAPDSQFQS